MSLSLRRISTASSRSANTRISQDAASSGNPTSNHVDTVRLPDGSSGTCGTPANSIQSREVSSPAPSSRINGSNQGQAADNSYGSINPLMVDLHQTLELSRLQAEQEEAGLANNPPAGRKYGAKFLRGAKRFHKAKAKAESTEPVCGGSDGARNRVQRLIGLDRA